MRKIIAVSSIIIVMIGGGYYYVSQRTNQSFKNTVAFIEKELPGSSIQYKNYSFDIFSDDVTMYQVSFKDVDGYIYTADKIEIPFNINSPLQHIAADNISFNIKDGLKIRIEHSYIDNLQYALGFLKIIDNKINKINFSKFKLDHAKFENVTITWSDPALTIKIGSYEINDYGMSRKTDHIMHNFNMERNEGKEYFKIADIQVDDLNLA